MKRKIKGVSIYIADEEFTREGRTLCGRGGGNWLLARPIGYDTLPWRIKCALRVFRGDADILVWEQDQVKK